MNNNSKNTIQSNEKNKRCHSSNIPQQMHMARALLIKIGAKKDRFMRQHCPLLRKWLVIYALLTTHNRLLPIDGDKALICHHPLSH